jgi:hypothetical protein
MIGSLAELQIALIVQTEVAVFSCRCLLSTNATEMLILSLQKQVLSSIPRLVLYGAKLDRRSKKLNLTCVTHNHDG